MTDQTTHDVMVAQTAKAQELLAYFQGARDNINNTLAEAASRHSGVFVNIYLDQATGDDANVGTRQAPVATVQRAVDLSPPHAILLIHIRGDYTTTARYGSKGRRILVNGCHGTGDTFTTASQTSERPLITPTVVNVGGHARVNGFANEYGSLWNFNQCRIALPSTAAVSAALPGANQTDGVSRAFCPIPSSGGIPQGMLSFRYCDLDAPPDYYGALFSPHPGATFFLLACTVTGSLAGKIHPAIPAGTNRSAAAHIIHTNLGTL